MLAINQHIKYLVCFIILVCSVKAFARDHNIHVADSADTPEMYYTAAMSLKQSGDFDSSLVLLNTYIELQLQTKDYDPKELARSYMQSGGIYQRLGRYNDALENYEKAETIIKNKLGENPTLLGVVYSNEAVIYRARGEYPKTLHHLQYALNLYLKDSVSNVNRIAINYTNLGNLYYSQEKYDSSLTYYEKSLTIHINQNSPHIFKAYHNYANCNMMLNHFKEADKYYKLAINHCTDKISLSNKYLNYGSFCIENNKKSKGYTLYTKAYELQTRILGNKHPLVSRCLQRMGDFWLSEDSILTAIAYYQKALIVLSEDFKDTNIYANPLFKESLIHVHMIKTLKKKAGGFYKYYQEVTKNRKDLEMSFTCYSDAIRGIEKMQRSFLFEESKFYLAENEIKTYAEAIKTACLLYTETGVQEYFNKAFALSERSKASVLLSALRETEAKEFGKIPSKLLLKQKNNKSV